MKLNHESKNMIAMIALVAAVALALNEAVVADATGDFLFWSLGLLCVSVLFWLWMRRGAIVETDSSKADDLTKIKGIAAGYQQILNEAGIFTYADLAKTSLEDLRAIFSAVKIASPVRIETVPRQAEYASKGDWEGLRAFQDSL